ncbi:hypothetical protein [Variovorax sp. dw_308]|uniref:hypothetical protein n=1 Tax=Variovorax sp. dw_308 TaxID=2721546 RepID=UPI001C45E52C|nr:hypothetical protein [Variovorax sp. dw_308]
MSPAPRILVALRRPPAPFVREHKQLIVGEFSELVHLADFAQASGDPEQRQSDDI